MHPAHLKHTSAVTPTAGDPRYYDRQPTQDSDIQHAVDQPYFPEGGVAAPPFMIVNPLSHDGGSFPGNGIFNELVGPVTATWIQVEDSKEQGVGVPAFKQWPRQFHAGAFNFNSLDVMPFPDQLGPPPIPTQRPVKSGWSVPKYAEQYQASAAEHSIADLMQTSDPASQAFAIGWGYVGG